MGVVIAITGVCDGPNRSKNSQEIYLLLDEGEILLKPTDTVIIQGVNHGWSNRSNETCLLTAVMIDATPRQ